MDSEEKVLGVNPKFVESYDGTNLDQEDFNFVDVFFSDHVDSLSVNSNSNVIDPISLDSFF